MDRRMPRLRQRNARRWLAGWAGAATPSAARAVGTSDVVTWSFIPHRAGAFRPLAALYSRQRRAVILSGLAVFAETGGGPAVQWKT